jgi:formylglycine-generating enzyme required for sulfatase activity
MRRSFALLALLAGCQPTGQLIIHVDSDANVPPRPGDAPDPARPPWLFDRLRIEISSADNIVATRDFELDEGLFLDGKVSFGLAPQPLDTSLVARIRMFRGDHALGGPPFPGATLDTTYVVPPIAADEIQHVTAALLTEDVGLQRGPITFDAGPPGPSLIGNWSGAKIVPCTGTAGPEEVCVPGGAYWMGDPLLHGLFADQDSDQERLVVISPFYIDLHEVTVAELRKLGVDYEPGIWNQSSDPSEYDTWCTYTTGPSAGDPMDVRAPLAVNCISAETAADYCNTQGKRLPSEAQYEFIASGRGAEFAYPWGNDEPACGDAIYGWGGLGTTLRHYASDCRTDDKPFAVKPPGSGARDRVALVDATTSQTREVVDLAGNLAEWSLDNFLVETDPFWSHTGVRHDPVYLTIYQFGMDWKRSTRGGFWYDTRVQLRSGYRRYELDTDAAGLVYDYFNIGFRCSRPGR